MCITCVQQKRQLDYWMFDSDGGPGGEGEHNETEYLSFVSYCQTDLANSVTIMLIVLCYFSFIYLFFFCMSKSITQSSPVNIWHKPHQIKGVHLYIFMDQYSKTASEIIEGISP